MSDQHFYLDGRILVIKRYENETDPQFQERSSFILSFRNDPLLWEKAIIISHHHIKKMFYGYTYNSVIEEQLSEFRKIHDLKIKTRIL
jgi:hypothetical protein